MKDSSWRESYRSKLSLQGRAMVSRRLMVAIQMIVIQKQSRIHKFNRNRNCAGFQKTQKDIKFLIYQLNMTNSSKQRMP